MSIVINNLKEAIRGESKAKRLYESFSKKAEEDGFFFISKIFHSISFAEEIHIKNHLRALSVITKREYKLEDIITIDENEIQNAVKTTRENLRQAIEGELYETKKMYKEFIEKAIANENDVAELTFNLAKKAERIHAKIFKKCLKNIDKKNIKAQKIFVCQICGNVEFQRPPSRCPICEHDKKFFKEI
ncbi:MAG: rubrerythrin family protein [Promethearchaeota archaeon]